MERSSQSAGREKHSRVLVGLALICTVVMVVVFLRPRLALLDDLEYRMVDWRFRHRGVREPTANIVIVEIDEESIRRVGRWPWPRSVLAELTERLAEAGAGAIIYDILFAEPDTSPQGEEGDAAFAAAVRRAGQVYLVTFISSPIQPEAASESYSSQPSEPAWSRVQVVPGRGLNSLAGLYDLPALIAPLPSLLAGSAGVGFADVIEAGDGIFRYVTPLARHGEHFYPALGLTVAADILGVSPDQITVKLGHSIDLADVRQVPIDRWGGRMTINFAGPDHTYPYLSAHEILDASGSSPQHNLEDAIVIVGVTAPGLYDLRPCPFSGGLSGGAGGTGLMNGAEMQANILDNLISAHFLRQVEPEKVLLVILFMGLSLGAMFALASTGWAVTYAAVLLVGYNMLCVWSFSDRGLIMPMLAPTLTALLTLLVMLTYKLAIEERHRRQVRQTLSRFVPPQIVAQLVEEEALTVMQGRRQVVSVLFCDLRDFTATSEQLDPEDTVSLLNRYFQLMHEVIWEFGGTLDKFMGDGLMAFFNAPVPQPDHAQLTVYTALEMQRRIQLYQDEWTFYGVPELRAGIGISTGEALVGCVSSRERMQYTVIGSHVNLASRLEELTKEFGVDILISETTYEQVKEFVPARLVGEVTVKGFDSPVKAYSPQIAPP